MSGNPAMDTFRPVTPDLPVTPDQPVTPDRPDTGLPANSFITIFPFNKY